MTRSGAPAFTVLWRVAVLGAMTTAVVGQGTDAPSGFTFLAPVPYDTGEAGPGEVEPGDYNADGLLDLAVRTSGNGSEIQLLYGDGHGALLKDPTLGVAVAAGFGSGDLNRDGRVDLAVSQQGSSPGGGFGPCGSVPGTMVFLGSAGPLPFVFRQCLAGHLGVTLTDVAAADLTGDGRPDLAVADDGLWGLRVYRGNGDGTFATTPIAAAGAGGIRVYGPLVVADANRDGRADVIARTGAPLGGAGGIATFMGDGTGGLRFLSTPAGGALASHAGVLATAVGDVNGDGTLDIAGVERGRAVAGEPLRNWLFVALGAGDGRVYSASWTALFPDGAVGDVVLANLDTDGAADLVAVHTGGDSARLHPGRGDGTFVADPTVLPMGLEPKFAAVADWDRDGARDLAVVDLSGGSRSRTWVSLQVAAAGIPDLVVTAVKAPAYAAAGQTYVVSDTTANRGTGGAGASHTRLYFSRDPRVDPGDADVGAHPVAALPANAGASSATGITVPPGTATGKYYLIAAADVAGAVTESNESNNTRARRMYVGPDLTVSGLTSSVAAAAAGTQVSLADTTRNLGAVSIPGSTTRFSLSTDRRLGATDVTLGARAVPALSPRATSTVTTIVTLPPLTSPGSYYLLATADASGSLVEAVETNNTRAIAIAIR